MTIDELYATCYPQHATEPTRMTVDAPKKAEEVNPEQIAEKAEEVKPEQIAEKAGEFAEQAIENIMPETTDQVITTTNNTSAESTEGVNNEETAGN